MSQPSTPAGPIGYLKEKFKHWLHQFGGDWAQRLIHHLIDRGVPTEDEIASIIPQGTPREYYYPIIQDWIDGTFENDPSSRAPKRPSDQVLVNDGKKTRVEGHQAIPHLQPIDWEDYSEFCANLARHHPGLYTLYNEQDVKVDLIAPSFSPGSDTDAQLEIPTVRSVDCGPTPTSTATPCSRTSVTSVCPSTHHSRRGRAGA